MPQIDWDLVIGSIQEEKCVLFLGPEIDIYQDYKNCSINEALIQELEIDKNDKISFHREDEFFIFDDKGAEFSTYFKIKKFFQREYNRQFFEKIVQIPFHLIISINPDTFLSQTFSKYNLPHKFDFYHKKQNPREIKKPTAADPLIYNLFGVIEQKESLILTHDDMYVFLHSIFGKNELPKDLLETLKSAYSFVFLGFKFDKWYVQLLLRLLHLYDDDKRNKYASYSELSDDLEKFCRQQFNISFVSNEIKEFVEELYKKCTEYGITMRSLAAKELSNEEKARIDQMVQWLEENKIPEVINELKAFAKNKNSNELLRKAVVISGRYNSVNEQMTLDIISNEDAKLELNKIRHALFEVISSLNE